VLRLVNQKEAIPLIGLTRDETFIPIGLAVVDDEPKSTAIAVFRHGDADFRYNTNRFTPKFDGYYRIRTSGYSVAWDGQQIVPTKRHGALSFGLSWAFADNVAVIFGYDIYNNEKVAGKDTVTTQLDINF
jgi:hypothetical protein